MFARVKVAVVITYARCDDRSIAEKDTFWNECNREINRMIRSYGIIIMSGVNGKVGTVPENYVIVALSG